MEIRTISAEYQSQLRKDRDLRQNVFKICGYLIPVYPNGVHPMNPQIEELRAEQEQIQQEIEQLEHQQVLIENKIWPVASNLLIS